MASDVRSWIVVRKIPERLGDLHLLLTALGQYLQVPDIDFLFEEVTLDGFLALSGLGSQLVLWITRLREEDPDTRRASLVNVSIPLVSLLEDLPYKYGAGLESFVSTFVKRVCKGLSPAVTFSFLPSSSLPFHRLLNSLSWLTKAICQLRTL